MEIILPSLAVPSCSAERDVAPDDRGSATVAAGIQENEPTKGFERVYS